LLITASVWRADRYNGSVRKDLEEIWAAALAAADPERAVGRALEIEDGAIVVEGTRFTSEKVFVVAAGKAAGAMAKAAEELLGEMVVGGLVVTKDGHDPGPGPMRGASRPQRRCKSWPSPLGRGIFCWRSSRAERRRCSPTRRRPSS